MGNCCMRLLTGELHHEQVLKTHSHATSPGCSGEAEKKQEDDELRAWRTADAAEKAVARRYECKICFSNTIETAFVPCGHALTCFACSERVVSTENDGERARCPVCKEDIEHTVRLWFS